VVEIEVIPRVAFPKNNVEDALLKSYEIAQFREYSFRGDPKHRVDGMMSSSPAASPELDGGTKHGQGEKRGCGSRDNLRDAQHCINSFWTTRGKELAHYRQMLDGKYAFPVFTGFDQVIEIIKE